MFISRIYKVSSLLFLVSLVTACVTADEVREIVDDSNRNIIVSSLGGAGDILPSASATPGNDSWRVEVDRIEAFIASHPDETRTNSALRIREAIILLGAGKSNLARAVFTDLNCDQLGNTRDRAICASKDHLIWWYGFSNSMTPEDKEKAREALTGLALVADGIEDTRSSIRRSLEEIHVRIATRLARSFPLSKNQEKRQLMIQAITRYGNQFYPAEQKIIQQWHITQDIAADQRSEVLASLRWYDYVPVAFDDAKLVVDSTCVPTDEGCRFHIPDWVACIKQNNCP